MSVCVCVCVCVCCMSVFVYALMCVHECVHVGISNGLKEKTNQIIQKHFKTYLMGRTTFCISSELINLEMSVWIIFGRGRLHEKNVCMIKHKTIQHTFKQINVVIYIHNSIHDPYVICCYS